jgi:dTDP-4-dehydrorhamnose 3,5-epimerase-like enzyme
VSTKPPKGFALTTAKVVKSVIDVSREGGLKVEGSVGHGFVTVSDGETVVYRALRKGGPGQPWVAMWRESENVKWKTHLT